MLIDVGGGTGILSMLAKTAGVGTVIYNDIYDVSCSDARVLARSLGCEADRYVYGDEATLVEYLDGNGIKADAIVSSEVIEHVYDVETFLGRLCDGVAVDGRLVMSTHANRHNYFMARDMRKFARTVELEDRDEVSGHKVRDSLKAYLTLRKEIVGEAAPGLSPDEVDLLAKRTRGMNADDIRRACEDYIAFKRLPEPMSDPTNTCDPLTGNWAERLTPMKDYLSLLEAKGLTAYALPILYYPFGRYGPAKRLINAAITAFFPYSVCLAPGFRICGVNDRMPS